MMCHFLGKRAEFSSSECARYLLKNALIFLLYLEVSGSGESANRCAGWVMSVFSWRPQSFSVQLSLLNQQRMRRQRQGVMLRPGPDPPCISERIQVRRTTGVTGVSGNDYQMAVIRFQGGGTGRSLDVSEDSSQQLQNHVWGKRGSVVLYPDESFHHSQISFIVLAMDSSPFRCLHLVVHLCLEQPCFFPHIPVSIKAI